MYKIKSFTKCLLLLIFISVSSLKTLSAQNCGALVCNNSVQISLGVNCDFEIEPDMVLEAPNIDYDYEISLFDENGDFIGNAVSAAQVNTTLQYQVRSSCDGNTCWGTIDLEANVLPVLESPCQFIAGDADSYEGRLSSSNSSGVLEITATDECQKVINLIGNSSVNYNSGSPGNPIWSSSDIEVIVRDAAGVAVYSTVFLPGAFSDVIALPTVGDYTVEFSSIVSQASGDIFIEAAVPNCNVGCVSWCGGSFPEIFLTPEQAMTIIDESCGASLVGDVKVIRQTTGNICDEEGVLHVISYTANITLHGVTQNAVLLTQAYREEKIDLSPNGIAQIEFPEPVVLDCELTLDDTFELGSPAYIAEATGNPALAYPTYVDEHTFVPDTNIIENIIHFEEVVGTRDTMVQTPLDLDGDGTLENVWVIITVVDKVLRDSIELDTVIGPGFSNPRVPVIPGEMFCNVLTTFSDLEFTACAGGTKIIRTWTMLDWCDSQVQLGGTQQIEISDQTAPVVERPDDVIVSIDPWQCTATYELPDLVYEDNCSSSVEVEWRPSHGVFADGYLLGLSQNQGPIDVIALVTDECGNTSETTFGIAVVDNVPPVMVCKSSLSVSLTFAQSTPESGIAKVFAETFDAGSHDSGCGDVTFQVARMEGCCGDECAGGETICLTRDKFGVCVEEGVVPEADDYGDYVQFCCQDGGQVVQVILLATDQNGNQNQCMIDVFVTDNSTPTLLCEDVTIDCDEDPNTAAPPTIVGQACFGEYELEIASVEDVAGTCGNETVIKEWFIDNDGSGDLSPGDAFCQQEITISAEGGFDPYTIKWPKHMNGQIEDGLNIECNDDNEAKIFVDHPVAMGDPVECIPEFTIEDIKPVWCETSCGLVGYSLEQDTIATSDACLTIVNRWSVVDWCTFDPNNEASESDDTDLFIAVEDWAQGVCASCPESALHPDPVYFSYLQVFIDGYYSYSQIIKVQDNTAPTIVVDDEIEVNTTGGAASKDDDTACLGETAVVAVASDFCGSQELNGDQLSWTIEWYKNAQLLDVFARTGTEAEVVINGTTADSDRLVWIVDDGCGNSASEETSISYVDLVAPTPLCLAGLTTAFTTEDGTVSVWASDFNVGSFDNCSSDEDLSFSIVLSGDDPIEIGQEGFEGQSSILFECSSLMNFAELDVYVWDGQGNRDFCTVGIFISDNGRNCPENADQSCIDESIINDNITCATNSDPVCGCDNMTYSNACEAMKRGVVLFVAGECAGGSGLQIAGQVQTTDGEFVDFTEMSIVANLPEYPKSKINNIDGSYAFSSNPVGLDYSITAKKEDTYNNGVSTLDLLLIQRHILGINHFTNPHHVIASDVNGSQSVTGSDLVVLRQRVLGTVPNDVMVDDSWVFAVENQNFVDTLNPWPYKSELSLLTLNEDAMTENFIGIKIGDVSGDVVANAQSSSSELKTEEDVTISADKEVVQKGESIDVKIEMKESFDVYGFQMGIKHQGLELTEIRSDVIDVDDESYRSENNQTKLNWYDGFPINGNISYTMSFVAEENVNVSKAIYLSDELMSNEVYVSNALETRELVLDNNRVLEGFTSQVLANPIVDNSSIEVVSSTTAAYQFTLYDATGNEVITETYDFNEGVNTIPVQKRIFPESGVYYYQLQTGDNIEVKPIVVID